MSRSKRVLEALIDVRGKLEADIKALHTKGMHPADYSLGFTNGVIFCVHHIEGIAGNPKFYDQKTSVGTLPKPVKFEHQYEEEQLDNAELEAKIDNIIDAALEVTAGKYPEGPDMSSLVVALNEYHAFLESKEIPAGAAPGGEMAPSQEVAT